MSLNTVFGVVREGRSAVVKNRRSTIVRDDERDKEKRAAAPLEMREERNAAVGEADLSPS